MSSRLFEDFRITDPPVEGEVAKGFRIAAALTGPFLLCWKQAERIRVWHKMWHKK